MKRHPFKVGTRVSFCRRGRTYRGHVLGYDTEGWALVGFGKTFSGHSGDSATSPVDKKYKDHCGWVRPTLLARVTA